MNKLANEQIVVIMRSNLIVSNPPNFKHNVFKFFRYLLLNERVGCIYNKVSIGLFMARSLEKSNKNSIINNQSRQDR